MDRPVPLFCSVQEEPRTIYHFHFTAWPDHGVPQDPAQVLAYLDDVNQQQMKLKELSLMPGPVVVHCRCVCGVGVSMVWVWVCVCMCVCVCTCLSSTCIHECVQIATTFEYAGTCRIVSCSLIDLFLPL